MAGFENDIMFAKNADFTQADNQAPVESNGLVTNGQLWVGSTLTNAGGTHINVGTLTSPDNSVTFSYSSPNITAVVAGGSTVGKTITGNTGGALSPTAGNWNILGLNSAITGYSPYVTGAVSTETINMPGTVKWVVNSVAGLGTHTTIQAAVTAASSGDDVFITPGSYTENLTLKAGVNLVAWTGDASLSTATAASNVQITGKLSFSSAGTVNISGIQLNTNSDNFLAVTGSAASIVNLNNCYLNCSNNTGISHTSSSSSAKITLNSCNGNIGTTGITLVVSTSAGEFVGRNVVISNSGSSSTASSTSSGGMLFYNSVLVFPLSSSSSGAISCSYTFFVTIGNITNITTAGTGSSNFQYCYFGSGSASAISIGSGTTVDLIYCTIVSSNTNAVTGAGTCKSYGVLYYSSSKSNVTTQTGGAASGLTQGTAPSAGFIGEQIRSAVAVGSAVSTTNNAQTNITSISLTAGIWDVSAVVAIQGTLTGTQYGCSISTTSGTGGTAGDNANYVPGPSPTALSALGVTIPSYRLTLASTTTVYLIGFASFSVGTASLYGRISATRVG